MKRYSFLLFLLPLLWLGGSSCQPSPSNPSQTATLADDHDHHDDDDAHGNEEIHLSPAQLKASGIQLGSLQKRSFASAIQATGYIDVPPSSKASVSPYHGGYVSRLDLLPGQKIRKGQWLMSLENPAFIELQQTYLEAKEQLTYLKADFERQQTLAQENIASQKQALKAESDYRVTLARFQSHAAQLKLLNINLSRVDSGELVSSISVYAPISGYVNHVHAVRGQFVAASEVAIELISTEHIHVELEVFEKDILKIKEGQRIFFQVPDMGGFQHEAEVFLIGHEVAGERRVVNIHGHLLNEEETHAQFVPGMFVEGRIALEEKNLLSLPEEALIPLEDKQYVLVQQVSESDEIHLLPQEVQLGLRQGGWIEILNAGEFAPASQIVLRGGFQLLQGEGGGHDH